MVFTNPILFNNELGGETLWFEDFETLTSNTPSGTDFGHFMIETDDDIDKSLYGTNGPTSLKTSENSDDFVKFSFDAQITAFRIDLKDALDTGGGSLFVTVDDGSPEQIIGPTVDLDNLNLIFIGVIDSDGFTMVKIDSDDSNGLLFYDNLQHSKIVDLPRSPCLRADLPVSATGGADDPDSSNTRRLLPHELVSTPKSCRSSMVTPGS